MENENSINEYKSNKDISKNSEIGQKDQKSGLQMKDIYRGRLSQYNRVTTPNKELLSEYVIRAKGPSRSLRQFAEELEVNVSTLSRIVNMKTSRANSDTLIADIAAMADKNSGITFEMLMEAHGMANTSQERNWFAEKRVEDVCGDIIVKELFKRGYSIALRKEKKSINTIGGQLRLDITVKTDAVSTGDGLWGIDVYEMVPQTKGLKFCVMQILRKISMLASLFTNVSFQYNRVSLIISDSEVYYEVIEHLKDCYLKYEMSLILVNLETARVESEFLIPWIHDSSCKPIFTQLDEAGDEIDESIWDEKFEDVFYD